MIFIQNRMKRYDFFLRLHLVAPVRLKWRGKVFQLGFVVHRDRSWRADAYGAVACFGRATEARPNGLEIEIKSGWYYF